MDKRAAAPAKDAEYSFHHCCIRFLFLVVVLLLRQRCDGTPRGVGHRPQQQQQQHSEVERHSMVPVLLVLLQRGGIRCHWNTTHGRDDLFGVDPPTEHRHDVGDSVVEPVVVAAVLPVVGASHDDDDDDVHGEEEEEDGRDHCSQIV